MRSVPGEMALGLSEPLEKEKWFIIMLFFNVSLDQTSEYKRGRAFEAFLPRPVFKSTEG